MLPCALCAALVVLAFVPFGFWWLDGLHATRVRYFVGAGGRRPYRFFLVGNIAVVGVVLGPIVAVALGWLRERKLVILLAAFGLSMAVANVSGMSKSEVERIWLPFTIPLLAAGSVWWYGRRPAITARLGLAINVGFAIALQTLMKFYW